MEIIQERAQPLVDLILNYLIFFTAFVSYKALRSPLMVNWECKNLQSINQLYLTASLFVCMSGYIYLSILRWLPHDGLKLLINEIDM